MAADIPDLIGEAPVFLDALSHTSNIAQLDRPVLVLGERGTGKELFASRVHFLSPRWDGPFIKLNCAALSDQLLESELFGHEAGAFTGATKRHTGRFERAEGGTLFLDEIATASLSIQEKLLRVIEYGEYERLGGEKTITADVRVVAATNANLPQLADTGKFRADLLDRLAFDVIAAPPLRQRPEDIPLLAGHFAQRFVAELTAGSLAHDVEGFTPEAMADLRMHDWPGNVRELKSAVERSVYRWITQDLDGPVGTIVLNPFPDLPAGPAERNPAPSSQAPARTCATSHSDTPYSLRDKLDQLEAEMARHALIKHGWNQKQAAQFLMLTYDQMRGLVRKYELKN